MIARRIKSLFTQNRNASSDRCAGRVGHIGTTKTCLLQHIASCISVLLLVVFSVPGYSQAYRIVTIADDLRWPWSLARLPDGDFLVTEREGRLIRINTDGSRSQIKGTPPTVFAGQGGFFDIVLHPSFRDNRLVYLSYATGKADANGLAVFTARLGNKELEFGSQILRTQPDKNTPQHYGGRMLFLADGNLLVTSGEGFEMREQAQARDSELGKVLRIDEDGKPAGMKDPGSNQQSRVWTLGHRNSQGIVQIPNGGMILAHEHGPKGGDELNQLLPGANYGWPAVTYGVDYSGAYVSPFRRAQGMQDPLWTWTPSIAPSGMAWYDGDRFPQWKSSLLIGTLVNRDVRRLQLSLGEVVKEEILFGELGERIRDVRVYGEDIYLLTDGEQGRLLQVRRR